MFQLCVGSASKLFRTFRAAAQGPGPTAARRPLAVYAGGTVVIHRECAPAEVFSRHPAPVATGRAVLASTGKASSSTAGRGEDPGGAERANRAPCPPEGVQPARRRWLPKGLADHNAFGNPADFAQRDGLAQDRCSTPIRDVGGLDPATVTADSRLAQRPSHRSGVLARIRLVFTPVSSRSAVGKPREVEPGAAQARSGEGVQGSGDEALSERKREVTNAIGTNASSPGRQNQPSVTAGARP